MVGNWQKARYFREKDATEKKDFLEQEGWLVRILKVRAMYVLYGRASG